MLILSELQSAIGNWSHYNFGEQRSKSTRCHYCTRPLTLGPLAPLMGIVEETCELFTADSDIARNDAVGDILIYLCDYAEREGLQLQDAVAAYAFPFVEFRNCRTTIIRAVGELIHCTLKRHQGIRGFDDDVQYTNARDRAVALLFAAVDHYTRMTFTDETPLDILNATWEHVSKRDWKANPQSAADTCTPIVPVPADIAIKRAKAVPQEVPIEEYEQRISTQGARTHRTPLGPPTCSDCGTQMDNDAALDGAANGKCGDCVRADLIPQL